MVSLRTTPRPSRPPSPRAARRSRRSLAGRIALVVGTLLVVSAASIAFALQVTPAQTVSALGQTVEVGAAGPTASASGPGEVVLFGQTLPTEVDFVGPVRPRVVLTNISVNQQLASLFAPGPRPAAERIGETLARGWIRYVVWEAVFVSLAAVLLLGAIAGWRRHGARQTLVAIAGGLVFVQIVNVAVIMVTAFTAPGILREVDSVSALVGREDGRAVPRAAGPALPDVQALVLGDSVAAGLGGPPVPDPTPLDAACERSSIAFATTLARVNQWNVRNLACSGATIRSGLLGRQYAGGRWIPPQIAEAQRAVSPEVVVVNVGANDMNWSVLVHVCAASDTCDDRAQTAYFQRILDRFTSDYYELLRQLGTLPGEPLVVINQYYVPFDPGSTCLEPAGLTGDKLEVLLERLAALNMVIASGAETFGYRTVQPDFSGHALCAEQSYVQGLDEPAPLHPNARGQLAIAVADERALLEADEALGSPAADPAAA
jgi:lysophospholipase L1-like esterase